MRSEIAALQTELSLMKESQAKLINLLSEVHNFSPAGSGSIPQWLETRVKVRQTLEKYGL